MLDHAQLQALAEHLSGTALDLDEACETLGFPLQDVNDLEDKLLDYEVERCAGCGWWCTTSALAPAADTDDGEGLCDDCKDD